MRLLDKSKTYIVACSFGPDSMALLNMAILEGYHVVAAHVNYHKRDVSNFEEESLKKYCEIHNVKCEVLDTANLTVEGNFQKWAREVRYNFFCGLSKKYNADAVLVAHQQDDLIETYLMQQQRGGIVNNPGIAEETNIFGIRILRPLLNFTKAELLKYNHENDVPFSIDISNLSNNYLRNKIRHEIVEKMSTDERANIIKEIESKSCENTISKITYKLNDFLTLSDSDLIHSISDFVDSRSKHIDLSKKFISEIRKSFQSKKFFVEIKLNEYLSIEKDANIVYFCDSRLAPNYCYLIEKGTYVSDEYFEIDLSKGFEERNIRMSDFPLTIKPVNKNDFLKIKEYECEVRRLFIDWKMPHYLRESWPGIYNQKGKLIYVPRFREKFADNHNSKFVIKFVRNI